MNPIPDEIGMTARAAIDTMKNQPLLIGLIIVLGLLLTFIFYNQQRQLNTRDDNLRQLFANQQAIATQWTEVLKEQSRVTALIMQEQLKLEDKLIACVTIDDAIKLMQSGQQQKQ